MSPVGSGRDLPLLITQESDSIISNYHHQRHHPLDSHGPLQRPTEMNETLLMVAKGGSDNSGPFHSDFSSSTTLTVKHESPYQPQHKTTSIATAATTAASSVSSSSGGGLSRTKSVFALSSKDPHNSNGLASLSSESTSSSESLTNTASDEPLLDAPSELFGTAMRDYITRSQSSSFSSSTKASSTALHFDAGMRKVMEPYLRQARSLREVARSRNHEQIQKATIDASIAGSVGVPYTSLRHERPFLFDEHSYPLHRILAQTLNISDLQLAHHVPAEAILDPLLNAENRHVFQSAYDNFVTSFCLPLLHSVAIAKNLFHWASPSDSITYRYQAFPTIRIARPGCPATPPRCGTSEGYSIGCIFFHVPLTPSLGDAAVYCESHPGKEDWHPLQTKAVGLGYMYDGARCLQFGLDNTSDCSRVSLDFCVQLYRDEAQTSLAFHEKNGKSPQKQPQQVFHDLCTLEMLQDRFTAAGPGYYEEAVIGLGRACRPGMDAVERKSDKLIAPDYRFGPPFC